MSVCMSVCVCVCVWVFKGESERVRPSFCAFFHGRPSSFILSVFSLFLFRPAASLRSALFFPPATIFTGRNSILFSFVVVLSLTETETRFNLFLTRAEDQRRRKILKLFFSWKTLNEKKFFFLGIFFSIVVTQSMKRLKLPEVMYLEMRSNKTIFIVLLNHRASLELALVSWMHRICCDNMNAKSVWAADQFY